MSREQGAELSPGLAGIVRGCGGDHVSIFPLNLLVSRVHCHNCHFAADIGAMPVLSGQMTDAKRRTVFMGAGNSHAALFAVFGPDRPPEHGRRDPWLDQR